MFISIGTYFLFIIPMTIAIVLGFIFEEKLIDFEERMLEIIKNAFMHLISKFRKKKTKTHTKTSKKVRHNEIRPLEMTA